MNRVAALSEGIALVYRQSRSKKIQPTFVQASDAASSKIKSLFTLELSPSFAK